MRIGAESGVTKYPESHVNRTDLHTVDKANLRKRLGRLVPAELRHVESKLRNNLGL